MTEFKEIDLFVKKSNRDIIIFAIICFIIEMLTILCAYIEMGH